MATPQDFLDKHQYTRKSILTYEKIFGDNFISPGGLDVTAEFVKMLKLPSGAKVLDIGCGIGGADFYMAKEFGAEVLAVDISENMLAIARERQTDPKLQVTFTHANVLVMDNGENTFHGVHSRDMLQHIVDKQHMLELCYKWLKPGGRLLLTSYNCREDKANETKSFQKYVEDRKYTLLALKECGKVLEQVGFTDVQVIDKTNMFVDILHQELKRMEKIKASFVKEYSEEDFQSLTAGWKNKVDWCKGGDMKWGLFVAQKPL